MIVDFNQFRKESLKQFYNDYAIHIQNSFQEIKAQLIADQNSVNLNFISILFDAINLFPEFRIKLIAALNNELDAWTEVVKRARESKEFNSPMTDEQIARMFIYSNDGISLRLLLEGRLDLMHSELITLWNNYYDEIKD